MVQAVADFVRDRHRWKKQREEVPKKIGSKPGVMMPRLLVVERYLKKKKTFDALDFTTQPSSTTGDFDFCEDAV